MSDATLGDSFVMLCDWRGRCVWVSAELPRLKVGEFAWEHLNAQSRKEAKAALGRVVMLREQEQLDVVDRERRHFHGWLWPLDSPAVAVCVLGMIVPYDLSKLTKRERAVLELLAQGIETKSIASRLDLSVSTVHTHMKRAREKLGLRSVESLISFSARYFFPATVAFDRR